MKKSKFFSFPFTTWKMIGFRRLLIRWNGKLNIINMIMRWGSWSSLECAMWIFYTPEGVLCCLQNHSFWSAIDFFVFPKSMIMAKIIPMNAMTCKKFYFHFFYSSFFHYFYLQINISTIFSILNIFILCCIIHWFDSFDENVWRVLLFKSKHCASFISIFPFHIFITNNFLTSSFQRFICCCSYRSLCMCFKLIFWHQKCVQSIYLFYKRIENA